MGEGWKQDPGSLVEKVYTRTFEGEREGGGGKRWDFSVVDIFAQIYAVFFFFLLFFFGTQLFWWCQQRRGKRMFGQGILSSRSAHRARVEREEGERARDERVGLGWMDANTTLSLLASMHGVGEKDEQQLFYVQPGAGSRACPPACYECEPACSSMHACLLKKA